MVQRISNRLIEITYAIISKIGLCTSVSEQNILKLLKSDKINVLFVCTGNICRSAYVEAYAKERCKTDGFLAMLQSAGTRTHDGLPANAEALRVAKERGIDLSTHTTSKLTKKLSDQADIIVVMEPFHMLQVLKLDPRSYKKTFFCSQIAGKNKLVTKDPYGESDKVFNNVFDELENCWQRLSQIIARC